jgi:hypothetical protein
MVDRRLSGQRLPVHAKPQSDELLSSWLMRLSLAHGVELRAFCAHLWPTLRVWGKDFDWRTDNDILITLAQKAAVSLPRVFTTRLKDYEGQLFEYFKPNSYAPWLLVNSMQDYRRRLPALQYCPQCLGTDVQPYFRRHWRLGFITICATHRRRLRDRCPSCREPINFHCLPPDASTLAVCYQCRFDLRLAKTRALKDNLVHQRLVAFQAILLEALATAGHYLPGHGLAPSYDYFRVLHQLTRVLITYRQAEYYRATLCRYFGLPDFQPRFLSPRRRAVEVLPINDRFQLMQVLAGWLDGWPDQFVSVCMDNMVWDRVLLNRMLAPPSWYEQTAQQVTWSSVLNRVFQQWEHEFPDWNPLRSVGQNELASSIQMPAPEISSPTRIPTQSQ